MDEVTNVKYISSRVVPEENSRGLDQLLVSSIFTILPETKRIFLFPRPTNVHPMTRYRQWGFTQDNDFVQDPNHLINLNFFIPFEYKTDQSDLLETTDFFSLF